jgi:hypothetical protein
VTCGALLACNSFDCPKLTYIPTSVNPKAALVAFGAVIDCAHPTNFAWMSCLAPSVGVI